MSRELLRQSEQTLLVVWAILSLLIVTATASIRTIPVEPVLKAVASREVQEEILVQLQKMNKLIEAIRDDPRRP